MRETHSLHRQQWTQYRVQILPEARPRISDAELPSLLDTAIEVADSTRNGPIDVSVMNLDSRQIRILVSIPRQEIFVMSIAEAKRAGIPDSQEQFDKQIETN